MRKHEARNAEHETEEAKGETSSGVRRVAMGALLGLLLVLCLRLTMTETLRQTMLQKAAWMVAVAAGKGDEFPPFVGPGVVEVLAAVTGVLAAVAAGCGAAARGLTVGRAGKFLVVAGVIVLVAVSGFHAANRYSALVGAIDVGMGLLAGWGVSVLCQQRLLGDRGRRVVIAALIAVLAAWTVKGLHQRFVEFPDTIAEYQKNREARLREAGIRLGDEYAKKLFESRVLAQEVSGFLSLSNVMAAGMIGLIATLQGLVVAGNRQLRLARAVEERAPKSDRKEISLPALLTCLGMVILIGGLETTFLTGSRGGFALSVGCAVVIGAGIYLRERVVAWRRAIVAVVLGGAVLGAVAIVGYGLKNDALPSKSLTFRWHYWTAASVLIRQAPAAGLGLNNFGDYYVSVKRPSTPEDVSDPHSFFVRFAAEAGVPVAVLVGGLIVWQVLGAVRRRAVEVTASSEAAMGWPGFFAVLACCAVWWTVHYSIAESPFVYNVYFLVMLALVTAGAAWGALALMQTLSAGSMRAIVIAVLAGAFGMLVYDQINMALVTGPVAMLFWVMLGMADSYDEAAAGRGSFAGWPIALVCAAGAVFPLVLERFDFNPAPYEFAYIRRGQTAEAVAAIEEAVARAPRSIELRTQRFLVKQHLHLPVAEDIRQILALDRANARARIQLATPESDLPAAERARILERALELDRELPDDELKRLPASDRAKVEALIQQLQPATGPRR